MLVAGDERHRRDQVEEVGEGQIRHRGLVAWEEARDVLKVDESSVVVKVRLLLGKDQLYCHVINRWRVSNLPPPCCCLNCASSASI